MARVIWKGSISFGLVHVPVGLYPAEQSNRIHFSLLDRRDMAPVGYRRINKQTGEEVGWDDIVKGYEYSKGEYVLVDEEDFRQANVEATQTVEIVDFVDAAEIALPYFDTPYYLEPIQKGDKAYALLRETLERTGKAGIAKVVLRSRQHLAALVPMGPMLVLELLRFADELRDPAQYKTPPQDIDALGIGPRELDMAQKLVESMVVPWQPERYKDDYGEDLLALIEEKVRRGGVRPAATIAETAREGAEVIDLMAQLKRSVERSEEARGEKRGGTARKPPAKKKAARKRA